MKKETKEQQIENIKKFGCDKFLYQSEESNYPQACDGAKLCNGELRLCKECKGMIKNYNLAEELSK